MLVLAADVGGTKSYLAIFERTGKRMRLVREDRVETARYPSLGKLTAEFLQRGGEKVRSGCLAVAGPVSKRGCRAVNLPWPVTGAAVSRTIGVEEITIVNDFEAVGHGLQHLRSRDRSTIQRGRGSFGSPIALIGAGTGLGEGFVTWESGKSRVHPSEGGHADFAPRNEVEIELLRFLSARYGHVSYERVLSGSGLASLLTFVDQSGLAPLRRAAREEAAREDPAAVVTRHAILGDDPACVRALEIFVSIYGAETGNLALKVLATGGVFIAGGIAARILPQLTDGGFLSAFLDKGRHASLLRRIPVRVVTNPKVGLLGAAAIATRLGGHRS